ncbi:hypothetical protein CC80DRAFT_506669 [Byssothecium circinans]|uniref:Uncharacterized protein n=1 Tax=Byssothecium circinans TaxID=147558 RepID=A0A6A5TRG0_9PLEO|nr:hypothetical protein CC80DRAFT_506669 [Byssothecium circinans]
MPQPENLPAYSTSINPPNMFFEVLDRDTRNVIYSFMAVLPYKDHKHYSGLALSCHQANAEMAEEGARKLFIELNSKLSAIRLQGITPTIPAALTDKASFLGLKHLTLTANIPPVSLANDTKYPWYDKRLWDSTPWMPLVALGTQHLSLDTFRLHFLGDASHIERFKWGTCFNSFKDLLGPAEPLCVKSMILSWNLRSGDRKIPRILFGNSYEPIIYFKSVHWRQRHVPQDWIRPTFFFVQSKDDTVGMMGLNAPHHWDVFGPWAPHLGWFLRGRDNDSFVWKYNHPWVSMPYQRTEDEVALEWEDWDAQDAQTSDCKWMWT